MESVRSVSPDFFHKNIIIILIIIILMTLSSRISFFKEARIWLELQEKWSRKRV